MTYLRQALEETRGRTMGTSSIKLCLVEGCNASVSPDDTFCIAHMPSVSAMDSSKLRGQGQKVETSGGHVNYYSVLIEHPTKPKQQPEPYWAECEDIIEALGMTFPEGEAFKSIWRNAAMRALGKAKAGDTPLRNAEKVEFFGHRMAEIERNKQKK